MLSFWTIVYLVCILSGNVNGAADFCGPRTHLVRAKGKIGTILDRDTKPTNCTWTISTPKRSVIHVKLDYLQLGPYDTDSFASEDHCLRIMSPNKSIQYLYQCSDATFSDTYSLPTNEAIISLESSIESHIGLAYSSYIVNCSYNELKCYNARYFSRNATTNQICADGMLLCEESCRFGRVSCGGNFCYDIYEQRCDGKLDCPGAEDESGCKPYMHTCPDQIGCINQTKCLTKNQICDEIIDCKSGFDEFNCNKFVCNTNDSECCSMTDQHENEQMDFVYILTTAFSVMFLLFMYLICRCLTKRDSRSMEPPMDVPLPPFRGPGESSTEDQNLYNDEDFRPGGEIYESFFSNVNQIKSKRKRDKEELELKQMEKMIFVQPRDGQSVLDKYFKGVKPSLSEEFAALATIKITRDMCKGLKKAKSEEKPITKLLFIDNKDEEESSEDSDTDDKNNKKGNCKWNNPTYSKSDTDYFRRKNTNAGPSHKNRV